MKQTDRTETEMTSMTSLVTRDRVRADVTYGTHAPDWGDSSGHSWRVTLRRSRRQLTVDFYMGPACCEDPTAADVLDCLVSDVRYGEVSFEEFCSDLGYEEDSRRAYATWEKCRELAPRVRRFLGDAFEEYADAEH